MSVHEIYEYRHHKQVQINCRVRVYESDGKKIRDFKVNLHYKEKRSRLEAAIIWAVSNNKRIEVINLDDEDNHIINCGGGGL